MTTEPLVYCRHSRIVVASPETQRKKAYEHTYEIKIVLREREQDKSQTGGYTPEHQDNPRPETVCSPTHKRALESALHTA